MNERMIREKMEEYDPDVVVSVHPTMNYIPLFSIRKIANKLEKEIPFFTVVTDFGSGHCTWFNKDVDRMYLASEPIKAIAQKRQSVPEEKIVMSGLPIRYDFAAQADAMGDRTTEEGKAHQKKIREELNIDPKKRMILVMGGGEGVGSLSSIVNELYAKLRTQGVDATICVVCGRNEQLKSFLETRCWDTVVSQSLKSYASLKSRVVTKLLTAAASRSRRIQAALDRAAAKAAKGRDVAEVPGNVDVIPMGFVTNMAEYMVAADVLVSKAGPGTIAEAAAVGLPIMVTSHLPGQEAGNVDIVLDGGFGDYCEDPETIALELACWLQDSQLLDVMSRKAQTVGHPHAAEEIAQDIGDSTHEVMEKNKKK
jgi:1,2-diacylglycerol 3-beta-galactosyltransferase